jgi:hypothetical protein
MIRSARYPHNMPSLENAIARLPLALAAALALCACDTAPTETESKIEQHLCPDGPCGAPDPKKDPPPPPPTYYYPANGWSVFNASEMNTIRGVQSWAYAWNGTDLSVKGYYPQDFGTGITVGSEPAHAFVTFHVISPNEWRANSKLLLPTTTPWGEFYVSQQSAYVQSYINDDGVIQQIVSSGYAECVGDVCSTHENYGVYQDDGTGPVLIQGTADTFQESAAQAVNGFLADYTSNGGSLLPPGVAFDNPCYDDECSNAPIQKYLNRKAQFQAFSNADPCLVMAVSMVGCGATIFFSYWFPPLLFLAPLTCGPAIDRGYECISEKIGGRSSKGPCAANIGPTSVTGPDGREQVIVTQVVNRENCDL